MVVIVEEPSQLSSLRHFVQGSGVLIKVTLGRVYILVWGLNFFWF